MKKDKFSMLETGKEQVKKSVESESASQIFSGKAKVRKLDAACSPIEMNDHIQDLLPLLQSHKIK